MSMNSSIYKCNSHFINIFILIWILIIKTNVYSSNQKIICVLPLDKVQSNTLILIKTNIIPTKRA